MGPKNKYIDQAEEDLLEDVEYLEALETFICNNEDEDAEKDDDDLLLEELGY